MTKEVWQGVGFAMLTIVIWAGTFIIARLIVGQISPTLMVAIRWAIALAVLCPFMLPRIKQEWPLAKKFMPQIFFASLLGIVTYPLFTYYAAETTTAVNISLIAVTSPIFVVIILSIMGEKQSLNTWVGCSVALLGSFYLVINGDLSAISDITFAVGDLIMLVAAIFFAMYSILLRNPPEGLSSGSIMTIMVFFTVVMLTPYAIWEAMQPDVLFNLNGTVIFAIIFSALLISVVSWWSWNVALTKAGAPLCNVLYYSMPILSGIFGYIFLGENMTSVHYISGALIIGGILWATRSGSKKATQEAVEQ